MKKLFCIICGKYRKFKNLKTSYIFVKTSLTLNYIEHFLILDSAIIGCISISGFASLLHIPAGITSSAKGLKICSITAGIKNNKSIIKK